MTSTSSQEFFFWGGEGPKYHLFKKVTAAIPAKGVLSEQQMLTMLNFVLLAYESGG